jgi:hypothetical protein
MNGQKNIKFENEPKYVGRLARSLYTIPPS